MCDSNTICDSINVNVEIKDSITNSNQSDNDSVLKTILIRSYISGDLFRGYPLSDRVVPMSGPGLGHGGDRLRVAEGQGRVLPRTGRPWMRCDRDIREVHGLHSILNLD